MSLSTAFRNLTGWQRLYAVVVLFGIAPAAALIAYQIDVERLSVWQVKAQLPRALLDEVTTSGVEFFEPLLMQEGDGWKEIPYEDRPDFTKGEVVASGGNYRLYLPKSLTAEQRRALFAKLYYALEANRRERLTQSIVLNAVLPGIAAALGLYAFGASIGWVRQGFKRGTPA